VYTTKKRNLFLISTKVGENMDEKSDSNYCTNLVQVKKFSTELTLCLESIEELLVERFNEKKEKIKIEETELKFKFAAMVIDRLFFYLAIIYSFVTFISIILTVPNFYMFQ
jgi:hypothetical protein